MAFPLGLRRRIRGLEGLANRICFVGESDSFLPRDQYHRNGHQFVVGSKS